MDDRSSSNFCFCVVSRPFPCAGQKACLHVHGVFPYLCVPFDEDSGERADKFAPMLASELDLLLNTAAGRAASRQRHVHHVEAFRGT